MQEVALGVLGGKVSGKEGISEVYTWLQFGERKERSECHHSVPLARDVGGSTSSPPTECLLGVQWSVPVGGSLFLKELFLELRDPGWGLIEHHVKGISATLPLL